MELGSRAHHTVLVVSVVATSMGRLARVLVEVSLVEAIGDTDLVPDPAMVNEYSYHSVVILLERSLLRSSHRCRLLFHFIIEALHLFTWII